MLVTFNKGELLTIEAHISQVAHFDVMRELCYKLGSGLRCLPKGENTSAASTDIDVDKEECWAIIQLVPIFYSVGGVPCGYTAKMKVYEVLASLTVDEEIELPEVSEGYNRTYKEALDARRESDEDDPNDSPGDCTGTCP